MNHNRWMTALAIVAVIALGIGMMGMYKADEAETYQGLTSDQIKELQSFKRDLDSLNEGDLVSMTVETSPGFMDLGQVETYMVTRRTHEPLEPVVYLKHPQDARKDMLLRFGWASEVREARRRIKSITKKNSPGWRKMASQYLQ